MTVYTLQSSKTPKAFNQCHFSSGLVKAVLIICSASFENCCSLNKEVTSTMLQAQYLIAWISTFFKAYVQRSLAGSHHGEQAVTWESRTGSGSKIQERKEKKKGVTISNRGRNRVFLSFPDTMNLTFSISCFLILSTLLSAVQYMLKILSWKMVFCTSEQLLKGILLELSVWKSTLAFHIHLAKRNSTHCSTYKAI